MSTDEKKGAERGRKARIEAIDEYDLSRGRRAEKETIETDLDKISVRVE